MLGAAVWPWREPAWKAAVQDYVDRRRSKDDRVVCETCGTKGFEMRPVAPAKIGEARLRSRRWPDLRVWVSQEFACKCGLSYGSECRAREADVPELAALRPVAKYDE